MDRLKQIFQPFTSVKTCTLSLSETSSLDPRDGRFPRGSTWSGGVGVGWVGDDNVLCTCTHGRCYATSWDGVGWGGVGDDNVPCTCTHGRCYATSSFLYLHTWSLLATSWDGVGDDNVPCTCTHGRCYATSSFLYLHTWWLLRNIMGWGGGMITFLALAHMVAATQHQLSCTCTHGRCYATSWDGVGWGGVGDD